MIFYNLNKYIHKKRKHACIGESLVFHCQDEGIHLSENLDNYQDEFRQICVARVHLQRPFYWIAQ